MLTLKYFLFFALISFTLQFDHCHTAAKICQNMIPTNTGSINNCISYNSKDQTCKQCKSGYAVAYEGNSCIQFSLCLELDEGNQKCAECIPGYYLKDDKCTKIPIDNCLSSNDGTTCYKCAGYSIRSDDGTNCQTIENKIDGCQEYSDDGKCSKCYGEGSIYTLNDEGICTFKSCTTEYGRERDFCLYCDVGYYTDLNDGSCISYTPSQSNYSRSNKIGYAFMILLLAMLI